MAKRIMDVSLSSNLTLGSGDMNRRINVNCTVASNLTLPAAAEDDWITIVNVGTATITVKNASATTLCTVGTNDYVTIMTTHTTAGAPQHDLKPVVINRSSGVVRTQGRLVVGSPGQGILMASASGTYYELYVTNAGALTLVSTGSSDPVIAPDSPTPAS